MKSSKLLLGFILLIAGLSVSGQQAINPWEKWNFLVGEWVGEGSGQPGQNEGKFSFQTDLDGKILVRKNHTVFPTTSTSPANIHDDLLIVYPLASDGSQEAIYFDNEGHTINYKVNFTETGIILTSDIKTGQPRFRLSYIKIDPQTVTIVFEMASPKAPEVFTTYLSGKAHKTK